MFFYQFDLDFEKNTITYRLYIFDYIAIFGDLLMILCPGRL